MNGKSCQVAMVGWMWLVLAAVAPGATTWHVDDDSCPGPGTGSEGDPFCSIQRAIDESVNGDEVVVAPGTYNETINFNGKAITLRSADGPDVTTIDASGLTDHVVTCASSEGPSTVLVGFTLTGAYLIGSGGGMYNVNSSPTVNNCIFLANVVDVPNPAGAGYGGGMLNVNSSNPIVSNCVFRQNKVIGWGGGGGMFNGSSSNPAVSNCTFVGNDAQASLGGGGGMLNSDTSTPTVTNCILWGNVDASGLGETAQIRGGAMVNYSLVQGGWTGAGNVGNINVDPFFVDPDGLDNIVGTPDDNLRLLPGSPAIDAGDNTAVPPDTADLDADNNTTEPTPLDLDGNPRFVDDPNTPDTGNPGAPGPIVDMGAFEFQPAPIPAVSEWGMVAMVVLLLGAGAFVISKRRQPTAMSSSRCA